MKKLRLNPKEEWAVNGRTKTWFLWVPKPISPFATCSRCTERLWKVLHAVLMTVNVIGFAVESYWRLLKLGGRQCWSGPWFQEDNVISLVKDSFNVLTRNKEQVESNGDNSIHWQPNSPFSYHMGEFDSNRPCKCLPRRSTGTMSQ